MAAARPVQGLQEEATCSICLEYYRDPVSTKCGHNFCRACITECSEGAGGALTCPQCREPCPLGDLRPCRQLQSMVELVKQLSVQQERPPGEHLCEEHEERLKLYCEEDEKLICVICREAKEHKAHTVRPLKEADQEYKSKLQDWLPTLRVEMEGLLRMKLEEEEDFRALKKNLEAERIKIVTEFEKLQQLLKEQEQSLLARLDEMEKKITTVENAKSTEISSLEDLMTEIERKCELPAGEFLKDFRSTLSRCEHVPIQTLEGIRKKYKGPVTLDADTAHARLALSEAGRRVTVTGRAQTRPENPKRFTGCWPPCVLGREGLTSGRRYWELEILLDRGWAVGVAQ